MSLKLNGATSGSIELDVPDDIGSDLNITIPGAAGTLDRLERAGNILQVVSTTKTDVFTVSVAAGGSSSAVTGLTATITPSSASNKILIMLSLNGCNTNNGHLSFSFLRDGSIINNAIGSNPGSRVAATSGIYDGTQDSAGIKNLNGIYLDSPNSTSPLTYGVSLVNVWFDTRTMAVNRTVGDANDNFRQRTASTITVMEVAA